MADILKMFKTITKALFRKTACTMYPVKPAKFYPNSRGHIEIEKEKCILCTICDKRCPTHAIKVDRERHTWVIDRYKCIYCNRCVEVCPKKCLHMVNSYSEPVAKKELDTYDVPPIHTEKSK